uniref:Tail protein n=1 Tax=Siphoviridae sp. ctES717 TaxID=2827564 RepID=A0A8S5RRQ9_9CAUD|nr:MAG TPA: tail protein [Siphoviridae sp. ctES717]
MIKIFNATDTDFKTAGNIIINPLHCHEIKKKSLNGWYIEVEIPIKYKEYIEADKLCVVKTKSKLKPQAFRINDSITYTNRKIKFTAEHVMFDSRRYVLLDVRPTNLNGQNGLKYVNERTDKTSPFSIDSNVENVSTAYFIRKTLLESWQVFEERWGGVFEADNWDISFKQSIGKDNGETIVYGKNMQGFEIFEDWSNVCTKILPVGYDGLLLPEIYLESETQYEISYTKIVDFQTDLEAEEQTETNLLVELRNNASKYLKENCVPKVSYTVNSNVNNELEIGDTIKVLHPFVNIFTEVLEYEYDLISEKVKSLTFGNYTRDVKTKFNNIKNTIETIKQTVSKQEITIKKQTNLINSLNKNGYVYIDDNEILILDKLPKEQAKNVWRFGLGGIGFSSKGYEGPFETAITMDGQINAKFITTGTMAVARIEGLANFITETSSSITKIELEQGRITSKVSSVEQSVESITKIEGTAEGKNIYIDDASAEPLIDIMLEGESQQATRSGKNRANLTRDTFTNNGVTFTNNGDGTYTLNGTATAGMDNNLLLTEKHFEVSPNNFYRLSIKEFNGSMSGNGFALANLKIEEKITWGWIGSTTHAKKPEAIGTIVMINYYIGQGAIFNNYKIGIQMEVVDSATAGASSWEPYGASPSPDYPSPIKNVEGKNKFNYLWFDTTKEVAWTAYQSITSLAKAIPIFIGKGKVATFSSNVPLLSSDNLLYAINDLTKRSSASFALGKTQTIKANNEGYVYVGYIKSRTNYNKVKDGTYYVQVEEGTVAKPYVPYNSLEFKDEGENLYNDNIDDYSKPIDYWICPVALEQGETYKLSGKLKGTKMTGCVVAVVPYGNSYSEFKDVVYRYTALNTSGVVSNRTITVDSSFTSPKLVIYANNKEIFKSLFENYEIQLNKGTVAKPYEPHKQQTEYFPLSEGQKLYKNSYLVDDGIHHKRNQVVLDGSDDEGWTLLNSDKNTYKLSNFINGNGNDNSFNYPILSNYFKSDTQANVFEGVKNTIQALGGNVNGLYISFGKDSDINRVSLLRTFLKAKYDAGTPVIVEYDLAEEEIVPYTEDQKKAWEKLRHFTLFRGINNITSTANAKITYVRNNGLSDTYETKRNVKENHYTKSEADSQISQTADSIKESVKEINEQTQEKLATLELANQSLEFATKRVGGNNLIRNSAMINDNNFWLAHAKYLYIESSIPPDPVDGMYWYCTENNGAHQANQMYLYTNNEWQESAISKKALLSTQNYMANTTSNEYWADGTSANESTLSGRVIKLNGKEDYTVSHIYNITEPIILNKNEDKTAISYFVKNNIIQGSVGIGLMFLDFTDLTTIEKTYSIYEPGILLTPDDLKDLTKIESIINIPKKSDFIPVVVSNTAPTDTTKTWLDASIYLPKVYNADTSQWELLDTRMSLYNEETREIWTYRYFYGFYYQTPVNYDSLEIKSCYVALTYYPAFAVYTGSTEPTPYKGLYWNNQTSGLVKRAKYNGTNFVEWETLDIPSSLLPTGASLGVPMFDYIVPIKGFFEIADLKLEYNAICTKWTQFPGEVYSKNYKMDEKGFWIQSQQNTMYIDEDEILATYKGINIFQINKDLAYFYKVKAKESVQIGDYFLKEQQINNKNMLLFY